MYILKIAVFGLLFYSLLSCLLLYIVDFDEDVQSILSGGILTVMLFIVISIFYSINSHMSKKSNKAIVIEINTGEKYYCDIDTAREICSRYPIFEIINMNAPKEKWSKYRKINSQIVGQLISDCSY